MKPINERASLMLTQDQYRVYRSEMERLLKKRLRGNRGRAGGWRNGTKPPAPARRRSHQPTYQALQRIAISKATAGEPVYSMQRPPAWWWVMLFRWLSNVKRILG